MCGRERAGVEVLAEADMTGPFARNRELHMRKLPGSPLPSSVGKRSFGKNDPCRRPPSGSYRKHQGPKRFHSSSPSAFVSSLSSSLFSAFFPSPHDKVAIPISEVRPALGHMDLRPP